MNFRKFDYLVVFLIALIFYGYFIKQGDWNINSRLGLVKAVVEESRLTIDTYHTGDFATEDKAFANGHYYSDKAIGASILGAIAYWPIYKLNGAISSYSLFVMLITLLAISVPAALLAPLIYKMVLNSTHERWFALAVASFICIGTAIFPYAGAFYGHSLAAMMAFGAFCLWMDVNQFDATITTGRSFLSGLLIGFLVITEYPTALIAAILIGYALYIVWSKKALTDWKFLLPFAAGGGIALALLLFYNAICFGSPFTTGYAFENLKEFQESYNSGVMAFAWPNPVTLFYMTFHAAQGVFIQSPVLFIAMGGIFWAAQNKSLRAEFITAMSIILIFFLMFSGVRLWWGGDAFSSRYLIPVLPFFAVFVIQLPKRWYPLFIGLGIISITQMLIASATTFNGINLAMEKIVETGVSFSWQSFLLYSILLPRLLKNKLTLTWGNHLLGIQSWYFNLAIPILAAGGLLIVFYLIGRQSEAPVSRSLEHDSPISN